MLVRTADINDLDKIKTLYKIVASTDNGIARREHEITDDYIENFVKKSLNGGFIIVAENPANPKEIIGEIHAYKVGIEVFDHLLSNLTIVVHPDFQGQKVGRTIFTIFLEEIALNRHDIGKVELMTRESNSKAINLYQSLGFRIEGRLEMRIKTTDNYEADIAMGWQNPNFEF